MTAKDLQLDYFQIYDLENPQRVSQYSPSISTEGQFDEAPEWARIYALKKVANPASKNDEGFFDENAHLTWYNMHSTDPIILRKVNIENQFGKQGLWLYHVVGLLVPARKARLGREFSEPTKLDHYKIYRVIRGRQIDQDIRLEDQFHTRETKVRYPVAFAVPVRKEHYRHAHEIHNQRAHLAIYKIEASENMPDFIHARDQFGFHPNLKIGVSYLLAAPSIKVKWSQG